ncbi:response regulator transcription factor [Treponema zioleckii]|uniref:response regulator transcription factor n=1 Tax=Treponema zioleckii TaxID=331680 RepID=UPI00168B04E8|nr:response regulator transcription factor [Treponema zioleckii]
MAKILIVEDDEGICDFVDLELRHEGFDTVIAKTGREGLEKFESENPDMILLDVMLPEINGLEVLRRIRKNSSVPVILETARGETLDKINGLNSGADDYISKPFDIEELLARMNAVLRRVQPANGGANRLKNRELELNLENMSAIIKGESLNLSKTEFMMLKFFMENTGKVLSRDAIIDAIWGKDHFIDVNTIDVYVGYLRSKIDQPCKTEYIKTVRGAGYMMVGS